MMCLLLLLVVTGIGALHCDRMLTEALQKGQRWIGREILQAPLTIQGYHIKVDSMTLVLEGVSVGNPEGFQMAEAIRVDEIQIKLNPMTLLREVWTIRELQVRGVQVTWEGSLRGSNIARLQRNIEWYLRQGGGSTSGMKKVIIDSLLIAESRLLISTTLLQGRSMKVRLPPVKREGVGEHEGGVPMDRVVAMVTAPFFRSLVHTTAAVGVGTAVGGPVGGAVAIPLTQGARRAGGAVRRGVQSLWHRITGQESVVQ
jgi:hypothetical protein